MARLTKKKMISEVCSIVGCERKGGRTPSEFTKKEIVHVLSYLKIDLDLKKQIHERMKDE